jgi:hypothetical protein
MWMMSDAEAVSRYEAGRIDRSGERRVPEPPQKPSAELKPVKPQRRLQARLEKPLALLRVEPRPAFQSCRNQINASHLASLWKVRLSKRNHENKYPKYSQGSRSRALGRPPKDPADRLRRAAIVGGPPSRDGHRPRSRASRRHRYIVRAINDGVSAFGAKADIPPQGRDAPQVCGVLGSLGFDGRNGVRVANLFAPERSDPIGIT